MSDWRLQALALRCLSGSAGPGPVCARSHPLTAWPLTDPRAGTTSEPAYCCRWTEVATDCVLWIHTAIKTLLRQLIKGLISNSSSITVRWWWCVWRNVNTETTWLKLPRCSDVLVAVAVASPCRQAVSEVEMWIIVKWVNHILVERN